MRNSFSFSNMIHLVSIVSTMESSGSDSPASRDTTMYYNFIACTKVLCLIVQPGIFADRNKLCSEIKYFWFFCHDVNSQ